MTCLAPPAAVLANGRLAAVLANGRLAALLLVSRRHVDLARVASAVCRCR